MKTVRFKIGELAPGLNGSKGLMRVHHQEYKRILQRWILRIHAVKYQPFADPPMMPRYPLPPCRVTITRHYMRNQASLMDLDNLYSTAKIPLDALRKSGVILEDDPEVVLALSMNQIRDPGVKNQAGAFTSFLLEWSPGSTSPERDPRPWRGAFR